MCVCLSAPVGVHFLCPTLYRGPVREPVSLFLSVSISSAQHCIVALTGKLSLCSCQCPFPLPNTVSWPCQGSCLSVPVGVHFLCPTLYRGPVREAISLFLSVSISSAQHCIVALSGKLSLCSCRCPFPLPSTVSWPNQGSYLSVPVGVHFLCPALYRGPVREAISLFLSVSISSAQHCIVAQSGKLSLCSCRCPFPLPSTVSWPSQGSYLSVPVGVHFLCPTLYRGPVREAISLFLSVSISSAQHCIVAQSGKLSLCSCRCPFPLPNTVSWPSQGSYLSVPVGVHFLCPTLYRGPVREAISLFLSVSISSAQQLSLPNTVSWPCQGSCIVALSGKLCLCSCRCPFPLPNTVSWPSQGSYLSVPVGVHFLCPTLYRGPISLFLSVSISSAQHCIVAQSGKLSLCSCRCPFPLPNTVSWPCQGSYLSVPVGVHFLCPTLYRGPVREAISLFLSVSISSAQHCIVAQSGKLSLCSCRCPFPLPSTVSWPCQGSYLSAPVGVHFLCPTLYRGPVREAISLFLSVSISSAQHCIVAQSGKLSLCSCRCPFPLPNTVSWPCQGSCLSAPVGVHFLCPTLYRGPVREAVSLLLSVSISSAQHCIVALSGKLSLCSCRCPFPLPNTVSWPCQGSCLSAPVGVHFLCPTLYRGPVREAVSLLLSVSISSAQHCIVALSGKLSLCSCRCPFPLPNTVSWPCQGSCLSAPVGVHFLCPTLYRGPVREAISLFLSVSISSAQHCIVAQSGNLSLCSCRCPFPLPNTVSWPCQGSYLSVPVGVHFLCPTLYRGPVREAISLFLSVSISSAQHCIVAQSGNLSLCSCRCPFPLPNTVSWPCQGSYLSAPVGVHFLCPTLYRGPVREAISLFLSVSISSAQHCIVAQSGKLSLCSCRCPFPLPNTVSWPCQGSCLSAPVGVHFLCPTLYRGCQGSCLSAPVGVHFLCPTLYRGPVREAVSLFLSVSISSAQHCIVAQSGKLSLCSCRCPFPLPNTVSWPSQGSYLSVPVGVHFLCPTLYRGPVREPVSLFLSVSISSAQHCIVSGKLSLCSCRWPGVHFLCPTLYRGPVRESWPCQGSCLSAPVGVHFLCGPVREAISLFLSVSISSAQHCIVAQSGKLSLCSCRCPFPLPNTVSCLSLCSCRCPFPLPNTVVREAISLFLSVSISSAQHCIVAQSGNLSLCSCRCPFPLPNTVSWPSQGTCLSAPVGVHFLCPALYGGPVREAISLFLSVSISSAQHCIVAQSGKLSLCSCRCPFPLPSTVSWPSQGSYLSVPVSVHFLCPTLYRGPVREAVSLFLTVSISSAQHCIVAPPGNLSLCSCQYPFPLPSTVSWPRQGTCLSVPDGIHFICPALYRGPARELVSLFLTVSISSAQHCIVAPPGNLSLCS